MAIASAPDVATAIGRPLTDTEAARVAYWLDAAEMLIAARLGDVSALDRDRVKYVETEAVVARLTNPDGFVTESIDDYSYRLPTESRRVTILDEWWALLSPAHGTSFYTVPVVSPVDLP